MPSRAATSEDALRRRMLSIFAEQGRESSKASRERLLSEHYVGWKDFSGIVHCDPHPDDGYLPLNLWENTE